MELKDIKDGNRVKLHPASDWFMRGIVFADVERVGRKFVHLDHYGRIFRVRASDILEVCE